MRIVHALAAFALTSMTLVACGAPEGSEASTDSASAEALSSKSGLGALGASCNTGTTCRTNLVCDLHCPVIPGRLHCEIPGGVCAPKCTETSDRITGKSFASTDGAHSITFETSTTFRKTDGCAQTGGIHCNHIQLTTGTYRATGTTVTLHADLGGKSTLAVEPNCYDGLLDTTTRAELYPSD
jgi:hypothetical protein